MGTKIVSFKIDELEYQEIEKELTEGQSIGLLAKQLLRAKFGYAQVESTPTNDKLKELIRIEVREELAILSETLTNNLNYTLEKNLEVFQQEIEKIKASKPEITDSKLEITLPIEQSKPEVDISKPEVEETKPKRGRKSNAEKARLEAMKQI